MNAKMQSKSNGEMCEQNDGGATAGEATIRSPSRDLQWCQSPMAWMASVPGHDDIRGIPIDAPVPPGVQSLCIHLLGIGGKMVCVPFNLSDGSARCLATYGEIIRAEVEFQSGEQSECHQNSALVWSRNKADCSIVTGFALSGDDKIWRMHSWVLTKGGAIIETTEQREAYFGFVLNEQACQEFYEMWFNED